MKFDICKNCDFCDHWVLINHRVTNRVVLHGKNKDNDTICFHVLVRCDDYKKMNGVYMDYRCVNKEWVQSNADCFEYEEGLNRKSCPYFVEHLIS